MEVTDIMLNKITIDDNIYGTGGDILSNIYSIIIDTVFPVGSTTIRTDNIDPSTLYTGTTWQKISEGRMLIGANSAYALGSTGGSADAVVVTHTHTQNPHTHTQNAHTHTQNAHTHTQDAHTHNVTSANDARYITFKGQNSINEGYIASATGNTYKYPRIAAGNNFGSQTTTAWTTATNQNATATNQNTTATNQNATATNQNAGVDGSGKNMPPYLAVNIWIRTA